MAFDISKLKQRHVFSLETESIGAIQCRNLTVGMLSNIQKALKANDLDAVTFARQLLREVGHHNTKRAREETEKDPEEINIAALTDEEIQSISDDEIETFSREFIVHNDWLLETYEGAQRSGTTNNDGENVVTVQPIPVVLPKENSERDSDYLLRVIRRYFDKQTERIRRAFRTISTPLFGSALSSATEKSLEAARLVIG